MSITTLQPTIDLAQFQATPAHEEWRLRPADPAGPTITILGVYSPDPNTTHLLAEHYVGEDGPVLLVVIDSRELDGWFHFIEAPSAQAGETGPQVAQSPFDPVAEMAAQKERDLRWSKIEVLKAVNGNLDAFAAAWAIIEGGDAKAGAE